jgi:hypothetical protein
MVKGTGIGWRVPPRVGHGPREARAKGSQHRDLPRKSESPPNMRRGAISLSLSISIPISIFCIVMYLYLFGLPHPYEAKRDDLDMDGWEKESLAPRGLLKTCAKVLLSKMKDGPSSPAGHHQRGVTRPKRKQTPMGPRWGSEGGGQFTARFTPPGLRLCKRDTCIY